MTEEQFNAEKMYQVSLSLANSMLNKGLLTTDEFTKINVFLLEKYRPILGSLLSTFP